MARQQCDLGRMNRCTELLGNGRYVDALAAVPDTGQERTRQGETGERRLVVCVKEGPLPGRWTEDREVTRLVRLDAGKPDFDPAAVPGDLTHQGAEG